MAGRADPGAAARASRESWTPIAVTFGNLLQRIIYHYWYHTGENQAIRQQLGHARLPQFVGNIDDEAPYRPESSDAISPRRPPG